jgi:hypothetical protein
MGVHDKMSHHHNGKIDAVLSSTAKPLFTQLLDEYVLCLVDDGGFVCNVFWDMSGASATPQPGVCTVGWFQFKPQGCQP